MNFNPDPADLVLSSVPGGELFNPRKHKFAEEDLKPQPMIKKAKKVFVPDEQKVTWYICSSECAAWAQGSRDFPQFPFDFSRRTHPPWGHNKKGVHFRASGRVPLQLKERHSGGVWPQLDSPQLLFPFWFPPVPMLPLPWLQPSP